MLSNIFLHVCTATINIRHLDVCLLGAFLVKISGINESFDAMKYPLGIIPMVHAIKPENKFEMYRIKFRYETVTAMILRN